MFRNLIHRKPLALGKKMRLAVFKPTANSLPSENSSNLFADFLFEPVQARSNASRPGEGLCG